MATERLKTIKSSGGDYTSLAAALAGEDDTGDLVSRDEWMHFSCYAMEDTTRVDIVGWTTDSTRFIKIDTPSTERHDGKWNDSKYRMTLSGSYSGVMVTIQESYTEIYGIQLLTSTTSYQANHGQAFLCKAFAAKIGHCIMKKGAEVNGSGISADAYAAYNLYNCLFIGHTTTSGSSARSGAYTATNIYNSTFISSGRGIYVLSSGGYTFTLKNCLFSGCTTDATTSSGTLADTYCATSNDNTKGLTAAGTGNRFSQTFTFVDAANGDYHLASNDAGAKDYGVSDPGSGLFSDDIDGQTRSGSWDIGADEYVSAGGIVIPVFMNQYRQRWN